MSILEDPHFKFLMKKLREANPAAADQYEADIRRSQLETRRRLLNEIDSLNIWRVANDMEPIEIDGW